MAAEEAGVWAAAWGMCSEASSAELRAAAAVVAAAWAWAWEEVAEAVELPCASWAESLVPSGKATWRGGVAQELKGLTWSLGPAWPRSENRP